MAHWKIGSGWSSVEIRDALAELTTLRRSFDTRPEALDTEPGWYRYGSESVIADLPPDRNKARAAFRRGRDMLTSYGFSDPRIVRAYFDERAPLLDRRMLLEIRAVRLLRFLVGVEIGAVREEESEEEAVFGFRYDSLEGHFETGSEWFVLTEDRRSGTLRFRISATWRPGEFPNLWSRLGFKLVGPLYQKRWHRRAHERLAQAVNLPAQEPQPSLPEIIFERRTQNA